MFMIILNILSVVYRCCLFYLRFSRSFFQHVKNCVSSLQPWRCFGFLSHTQGTPGLAGPWLMIRDSRNAPPTNSLAALSLFFGKGVPSSFFVHCIPSHSSSFLHSSLHSSQLRAFECPQVIPKLALESRSTSWHSLQSHFVSAN